MGRFIKLTIEYDGTGYAGWQRQKNAVTIQEVIERALSLVSDSAITLHGSGRTDAGVHALGQVAHFFSPADHGPEVYKRALNKLLPDDIVILDAVEVGSDFHARYNAKSKTYRYLILNRSLPSAFERRRVWFFPKPLDVGTMADCLRALEGTHDFSSFRAAGSATRTSVRTLTHQSLIRREDGLLTITLSATGFLRHMARNIVGTLVEAGLGKITLDDFNTIVSAMDRSLAGPTAPPQGLYLVEVRY